MRGKLEETILQLFWKDTRPSDAYVRRNDEAKVGSIVLERGQGRVGNLMKGW